MQTNFGAPGGTRTPDLQVRSLPFYPAKLQAQIHNILYYYTVYEKNIQEKFKNF